MAVCRVLLALACGLAFASPVARAAAVARSVNFIVMAPDQPLADEVLSAAERLRSDLATEWFGRPIPPSIGATVIHIELAQDQSEDGGLFWAVDDARRRYHKLWLKTSRERAAGSSLGHELTHLVFTARFTPRLPIWVEEGAASLKDDDQRKAIRRSTLEWFAETGNWPRLGDVIGQDTIGADDTAAYCVAASLAEFLIAREDKVTFVRFGQSGASQGWDRAAAECYGLASLGDLQTAWQAWVATNLRTTARFNSASGKVINIAALPPDGNQRPPR